MTQITSYVEQLTTSAQADDTILEGCPPPHLGVGRTYLHNDKHHRQIGCDAECKEQVEHSRLHTESRRHLLSYHKYQREYCNPQHIFIQTSHDLMLTSYFIVMIKLGVNSTITLKELTISKRLDNFFKHSLTTSLNTLLIHKLHHVLISKLKHFASNL